MTDGEKYALRAQMAATLLPFAATIIARPTSTLQPGMAKLDLNINRAVTMAIDLADGIISAIGQKDAATAKAVDVSGAN